jgi:hypothetical protein
MEDLSKSQFILLTILVNFVTAVATAILTVSLLDQAPAIVSSTVNHVVERTIETVTKAVPTAIAPSPAPSTQDLVTSALAADAARVVAIYPANAGTSTPAVAVGTYLSGQSIVVTAAADALPHEALIGFSTGDTVPASLSRTGKGLAVYGFASGAKLPNIPDATLVSVKSLKLGQTALAISADGTASTGIVSRAGNGTVNTSLPNIGAGSAAVDLSGNLIGISAGVDGTLIDTDRLAALLAATSTAPTASSTAAK